MRWYQIFHIELSYRVHHKSGISSICVVLMMLTTMLALLATSNVFSCIKISALLVATSESAVISYTLHTEYIGYAIYLHVVPACTL